jgi:hypothetical protein
VIGTHIFLEVTTPEGSLVWLRYISPHTGDERALAQQALDRMTLALGDGWRVRAAHVFLEPPATFHVKPRTSLEAADRT